jgi:hypothetical protein
MNAIYVGNFVAFEEFGTKITDKDNYESHIRNASKVMNFNGTLDEAVEYIKQYFGGN